MAVRLHLPNAQQGSVVVRGEKLHYLLRVLRLQSGDALWVFDGAGRTFSARVSRLGNAEAELLLDNPTAEPEGRRITVIQGLPKADKMEWVLQKGTELGVFAFAPVATQRSIVRLSDEGGEKKQVRWQRIVEEAARQCGRSTVPEVLAPISLEQRASSLPVGTALLVLDEEEKSRSLAEAVATVDAASGLESLTPLALAVGPEGGFAREEIALLQSLGALPVTLGPRVLRTETAALVALSVLQFLSGELGR